MSLLQTLQAAPQPVISPAALEARRQIAMAMLKEGSQYSPIQSPWQGVARVTDAIMGGMRSRQLDQQEMAARQAGAQQWANSINSIFGGGASNPSAAPTSPVTGLPNGTSVSDASPAPVPPADVGPQSASGDPMAGYANAIASIESDGSGGYRALGPTTKTGDRAYGRYQVMGANIPQWTQAALGQSLTPQQFLASPEAQDAVFNHQFGQYVQRYGNPQDAAAAWFTGGPLSSGANKADINGTTGNAYVDKFNRALASNPAVAANAALAAGQLPQTAPIPQPNPTQVASLDPSIGMPDPGSDIYNPPPMPAPYDGIKAAIPQPDVNAAVNANAGRLLSGQPQSFPPEFGGADATNPPLPAQAPIPTPQPMAPIPSPNGGGAPVSPLGQQLLMDPHALSGDGSALPPASGRDAVAQALAGNPPLPDSAPVPSPSPNDASAAPPTGAGAATVAAAMNGPTPASPAPMGGIIGPAGRVGMDPSTVNAMAQVMANPWIGEGQQQMLGGMIASRLSPHKLEMVPLGNGDTAEIDSITGQQVGMIHGIKPPVAMGYDQRLVDPMTGNQIGSTTPNGQLPFRFMTQQEKQAAGLPLDTPIQIGPDGKMVSNGVTVNTGTPQSQYSDEMAKGLSGPHLALENGVEAAQEQQRDIHAMQAAVQQIQQNGGTTGLGQPEILKLQSAINTGANLLGVDQPFDISDKEFLTKFNRQIAGAQAKNAAGARVTNFELKNYLAANPGLEMSPQGNARLLGIQSQILQRNIDLGQALRAKTAEAVSQGRKVNPAENEQLIRDYDAAHHITDPITGQDLTKDVKLKDLQTGGASGGIAQPKSQADYDALPPGTIFQAPDGSQRRKPPNG